MKATNDLEKWVGKFLKTRPRVATASVLSPLEALRLLADSGALERPDTGTWMGKIGLGSQEEQREMLVILTKRPAGSIVDIMETVAIVGRAISGLGATLEQSEVEEVQHSDVGTKLRFLNVNQVRSLRGDSGNRPDVAIIRFVIQPYTLNSGEVPWPPTSRKS